ncbi:MAG: Rieske 2Fe-2S domain-containing protein, partial [Acidobacteria bacterium]|nr:Rieske 2Fe-2S domain-containing protein [Acidobacteriota bacterium]
MFLRNAWYVAAWSSEIGQRPRQIRVLGERVCLFRPNANEVVALEDACPHRKLPLSQGRVRDGNLECGYHGLTFDVSGQCVWAPGSGRIPPGASVRPYPVHEKYGLVWIW